MIFRFAFVSFGTKQSFSPWTCDQDIRKVSFRSLILIWQHVNLFVGVDFLSSKKTDDYNNKIEENWCDFDVLPAFEKNILFFFSFLCHWITWFLTILVLDKHTCACTMCVCIHIHMQRQIDVLCEMWDGWQAKTGSGRNRSDSGRKS